MAAKTTAKEFLASRIPVGDASNWGDSVSADAWTVPIEGESYWKDGEPANPEVATVTDMSDFLVSDEPYNGIYMAESPISVLEGQSKYVPRLDLPLSKQRYNRHWLDEMTRHYVAKGDYSRLVGLIGCFFYRVPPKDPFSDPFKDVSLAFMVGSMANTQTLVKKPSGAEDKINSEVVLPPRRDILVATGILGFPVIALDTAAYINDGNYGYNIYDKTPLSEHGLLTEFDSPMFHTVVKDYNSYDSGESKNAGERALYGGVLTPYASLVTQTGLKAMFRHYLGMPCLIDEQHTNEYGEAI